MCTVTFFPVKNKQQFILTSNRDERSERKTFPPEVYSYKGISICYPKDVESGGSWIAMNENQRIVCLLNGGFVTHTKQAHHTHSRGKVLRDLISTVETAKNFFESQNLENTEPFTLVTIDLNEEKIASFSEFIWDGLAKHYRDLNTNKAYIWSSATLYSEAIRAKRKSWFENFLDKNGENIAANDIFDFHSGEHTTDQTNNLVMERENELKTVSITQVQYQNGLLMNYFDLLNKTQSKKRI